MFGGRRLYRFLFFVWNWLERGQLGGQDYSRLVANLFVMDGGGLLENCLSLGHLACLLQPRPTFPLEIMDE